MTQEELQQFKALEERIIKLEKRLSYPVSIELQRLFEQTFFKSLRISTLYGGLPIFTKARIGVPAQGEIWLSDISGTRKLNAYISGTTYSITIT